jgi:hypothetical protein
LGAIKGCFGLSYQWNDIRTNLMCHVHYSTPHVQPTNGRASTEPQF